MSGGLLYLVLGFLASTAYFTVPQVRGNGLLYSLIGLSAAVAIAIGAIRNRPRHRLPWILFAAAQVSFVVGDFLYYEFHFDFPSVGDAFYLAVYPLLVAGLLLLIRSRNPGRDRGSLIDASLITVGLGLLAWVFLIEPYTHLDGLSTAARVISISYPLMDVLLLAVGARLLMGSGSRSLSFYLIGIGLVSLLFTDSVYGYIELHAGYNQGALLDAGWLAYYILFGTAALLPGMRRIEERSDVAQVTLTGRRLVPLAAATLIAPCVGIIQSLNSAEGSFSVSAVTSAVLFLLVLARMTGLVKSLRVSVDEEHRAVFREGVLRQAAVALGGAPDRDALQRVTLDAAKALTAEGGDIEVSVHLRTPSDPAWGRSYWRIPIATQASDHGWIGVTGRGILAPPARAALESLGAQAGIALERAALADDLLRRRSDERMAAIVQQTSDVITVLDADLVVRHQTGSVGRFLHFQAGSLTGRRFLDLVHDDDLACAEAFFADLVARPGPRPNAEFRLLSANGAWVAVEALGNNLLADARVQGIVVTIRDISERKALEEGLRLQVEELTELDRIKTDLVSTVSHELRTPLTTVVGHVEMLTDGEFGELTAEQLWAVSSIERNSKRLLTLIEDVLTLAKIENGGLHLILAPTDVASLVDDVAAAAAPMAATRDVALTIDGCADTPDVVADRSALERALMNLVSNAVKFTPAGGSVTLRVTHDDHMARFAVADTGIGMSDDDKARLFTRFFRSPTAMSMAIPGTGLGLAIVKQIVDDHGGTIHVESVAGAGTTITFSIPLVPAGLMVAAPVEAVSVRAR